MFQLRLIAATLLLACLLSVLSHTARAYGPLNHACCVKYTQKPLPFKVIKGFIEQSSREVCRIDAIIFFTRLNKKVCASAKDEWVKIILQRLSSKLKTLGVNSASKHMDLKTTNPTEEP
ncbi:hypothetical protein AAFF_G00206700 [Aldrovandia affinis]|uniref:Chemokine interleukin-8-like domain-containing protein n=1 Tax=Aldrovandia affinis TaxID=143900 RepID=A0AAD7W5N5_9TELE|nr:hypothetical protein AAFF_G00206700 [Aldrovandia affinis]